MQTLKKHVSIEGLLGKIRHKFSKIPSHVTSRAKISDIDCLMSALAMFQLKSPSLLDFDEKVHEVEAIKQNLNNLYGVSNVPSNTYMRERLDEVDPKLLRPAFSAVFTAVQRQKILECYEYYKQHYLVAIDATGYFSSHEIHCDSCCEKNHKDGSKTYHHNMLGAVLVHPDETTVIPLAPEAMLKQDGYKKNDCEMNAAKRLLPEIRKEHPHLKIIIVEDALYGNAPHINMLKELDMHYIIGVKPDNHEYLFEAVNAVKLQGHIEKEKQTTHKYRWLNDVILNDSNQECRVNFLEYEEHSTNGKLQKFTWITDLPLTKETVTLVMKGGRARWHIENQTFNTLKNQGYQFEHAFGHGYKHLSTVLAMLMFLAFLVDQVQETCCEFFQKALKKLKRKKYLWEKMRTIFGMFLLPSWQEFYEILAQTIKPIPLSVVTNSS